MPQTTEIPVRTLPHTPRRHGAPLLRTLGSTIALVAKRSVFWSYERGSWQYDVIVLAILAFIFISPRAWFNDRPTLQLTDLRHQQGIVEMGHLSKRDVRYLVDARLIDSLGIKPEDAIPVILQQHLQKSFTVKSIDPVRDRHQVVLGYTVVVEQ